MPDNNEKLNNLILKLKNKLKEYDRLINLMRERIKSHEKRIVELEEKFNSLDNRNNVEKKEVYSKKLQINHGKKNIRICHQCGYTGEMKTWLANYSLPQFIVVLGFLFYLIPGLIFMLWNWGKYKCPHCGNVGKSSPVLPDNKREA